MPWHDELPDSPPFTAAAGCGVLLLLLPLPFAGYKALGLGGLFGGLGLLNLGMAVFFLVSRRGHSCAACGRALINRQSGSTTADRLGMPGVMISSADLFSGRMSPASLCRRCGRIYCGCSYPQEVCDCGSQKLRSIAVEYPAE